MPDGSIEPVKVRVTTIFRDHSEVVWQRLAEQHQRVMEVAESIEAAKDAWDRSGLVCGVEVGKQTDALEAAKQMESLLKAAAETLINIANAIRPPGIWQMGEDSIRDVITEQLVS